MIIRGIKVRVPPLNPPLHFIVKRSYDYTDSYYSSKEEYKVKELYLLTLARSYASTSVA